MLSIIKILDLQGREYKMSEFHCEEVVTECFGRVPAEGITYIKQSWTMVNLYKMTSHPKNPVKKYLSHFQGIKS